jgi:hypothetical protein
MIMDVAHHRLFKPPQITDISPESCQQFFRLKFYNKGIDAVNLSNILRHKKVQSCIPEYFMSKSTPRISYTYTPTIASKLFKGGGNQPTGFAQVNSGGGGAYFMRA